jgi:hypothetical protein
MLQAIGLHPVKLPVSQEKPVLSIGDRVFAAVISGFSSVMRFFENLMRPLIDSNWQSFVVHSRGELDPRKSEPACREAFQNALKLLESSSEDKDPMKRFLDEKGAISIHAVYNLAGPNGICFGSCIGMVYSILEAKRLLTISELKDVENAEEFVKTAHAVQFMSELCAFYNQDPFRGGSRISMLDALHEFGVLPKEKLSKPYYAKISGFKEVMLASQELQNPNFCGGAIIAAVGSGSRGHSLLLEIDRTSNLYILYDSNRGFYKWHDFFVFLSEIEKSLTFDYNFNYCNVAFFRL